MNDREYIQKFVAMTVGAFNLSEDWVPIMESLAGAALVGIIEAIAVERETCAKIAESEPCVFEMGAPDPQHRIAAKIRERK